MVKRLLAFTLTELLVSISIIGLLMGILLPMVSACRALAHRTICATHLKQIALGLYNYNLKYDSLFNIYDVAGPGRGNEEYHPYLCYRNEKEWLGTTGKPVALRLACLYESRLVGPETFYCGAIKEQNRTYRYYPAPWGTFAEDEWIRSSYDYFITERKFAALNPKVPICTDTHTRKEIIAHRKGKELGLNVTFPDARVCFVEIDLSDSIWQIDADTLNKDETHNLYQDRMKLLTDY